MATIYVRAEGTEGDPEEFLAGRTLKDVATRFSHDSNKTIKLKKQGPGYITVGLDMQLSELSSLAPTTGMTGDGSADDPHVVHIERSGAASDNGDAGAGAAGVSVFVHWPKQEVECMLPIDRATGRVNLTPALGGEVGLHLLEVQGMDIVHPEDLATYKPQFKRSRINKINMTPVVQPGDTIFVKAKRS